MSTTSQDKPARLAKRACTECRQQKAKCDSYLHSDQPCSRCRRLNIPCFISDVFKRQHKRDRLYELEQEAQVLRKKLRTSESTEHLVSNQAPAPRDRLPQPPSASDIHAAASTFASEPRAPLPELPKPIPIANREAEDPTLSRTLNGVLVTAREIDEIYHIFFHNYSQCLQILDSRIKPNAFYNQSEFLFWSIIGVACRKYSGNPTLFSTLSPSIIDLALLSTNSSSRPIFAIQGMLLLLTWPLVRDYSKLDVTYPVAGLLMHKARQIGLHQPFASHEFHFSKERSLRLTETELAMRSDLWTRCVVVYQRTCVSKGQLPQQISIEPHTTDPGLKIQLRCDDIVTRCCASVIKNGLQDMNSDRERPLELILEAYSNHIKDIETEFASYGSYKSPLNGGDTSSWETRSAIGSFHIQVAQLNIQIFHLYRTECITFHSPLASLLNTACKVLDLTESLLESPDAPPSAPHYITYALMLSIFVLLRLVKFPSTRGIDVERATSCLSYGIKLAKKSTLHNNDISAKIALFATQLWNSPKAFRKEDGSADMAVRVFNRLTMGPVVDIVWRWYDLFDDQAKVPNGVAEARKDVSNNIPASSNQIPAAAAAAADTPYVPSSTSLDFPAGDFFGDVSFADFDWALGDDFFTL